MNTTKIRFCILPALCGLLLCLGACASPETSPETSSESTYEERMAEEHKDDVPEPTPAAEAEPAVPVTAEDIAYAQIDGVDVSGYLARPEGAEGPLPALIVIHEWWGLNDNIRAATRRLAGEGYLALAVDLYGGESAAERDGARALATAVRENPAAAEENLRQAYAFLGETHAAPAIGSIGWCFGGGWSLSTALMQSELDAAIIYYGRVETDAEKLAALETPVLGHFGALDGGIPIETVREFESALGELGKAATIHVYEDADHAFANPSGQRYQKEAAEASWERTVAFLAEHLQSGAGS